MFLFATGRNVAVHERQTKGVFDWLAGSREQSASSSPDPLPPELADPESHPKVIELRAMIAELRSRVDAIGAANDRDIDAVRQLTMAIAEDNQAIAAYQEEIAAAVARRDANQRVLDDMNVTDDDIRVAALNQEINDLESRLSSFLDFISKSRQQWGRSAF